MRETEYTQTQTHTHTHTHTHTYTHAYSVHIVFIYFNYTRMHVHTWYPCEHPNMLQINVFPSQNPESVLTHPHIHIRHAQ